MATFERDLDLRGKVKLINAILQSSADLPYSLANKQGGIYFNTTDKNIMVNPEGTSTWFNTLLWNSTAYAGTALPIFSNGKKGYIERLPNSDTNKFVYLDTLGQPTLKQYVDFNWLDPAIRTDDYTEITNGGTKLPNANAVYDFVTAAISTATGSYLPLAGGTMVGNILMGSTYKINFFNTNHYIYGVDGDNLVIHGKTRVYLNVNNGSRVVIESSLLYPAITTNTYDIGSVSSKFRNAYFGTTVFTPLVSSTNLALTGSTDITFTGSTAVLKLDSDGLYPNLDVNLDLGKVANRWANLYSAKIVTSNVTIGSNAITSFLPDTTGITSDSTNAQLPTALAVWDLFDTIQPIDTTTSTYGTVLASPASNPENYYLQGDNTWQSLLWDLTGTTVTLKSGISATVFNVAATNTIAFKVRGNNYLIQGSYDGADATLYLGQIGPSLATLRYYPIEVVSDLRTRSSILFGGASLSDVADIELQQGSDISSVPVLTVGSSYLQCGGITTNGTNVWKFGLDTTVTCIPDTSVSIYIDGQPYLVPAEIVE